MAMAMPAQPLETSAAVTTVDSLKDDNIQDILLRLPSLVSIARAALASKHWRRVASDPDFLRRLRKRHPSLPLICFFTVSEEARVALPSFRFALFARFNPDVNAIARGADFSLTGLEDDPEWRLRDFRDSRLLLSRGKCLSVYDPISRRRVTVRRPHNDPFPDVYIADCLLVGNGAAASTFRLISVQRHGRSLRAVEYIDDGSGGALGGWRFHPWVDNIWPHHQLHPAMHAAGRIFLKSDDFASLSFDTNTMEFCVLPHLASLSKKRFSNPDRYCIGETGDGACCLVGIHGRRLQVWLLGEDLNGGGNAWELEKDMPVRDVLAGNMDDDQVRHVGMVAAGLVVVWRRARGDDLHQYIVDLKEMSMMTGFLSSKLPVYPLRMPWPSAGLAVAGHCHAI